MDTKNKLDRIETGINSLKEDVKNIRKRERTLNLILPLMGVLIGGMIPVISQYYFTKMLTRNDERKSLHIIYESINDDLNKLYYNTSSYYENEALQTFYNYQNDIDHLNKTIEEHSTLMEESNKLRASIEKSLNSLNLYIDYAITDSCYNNIYCYEYTPIDSLVYVKNNMIVNRKDLYKLIDKMNDDLDNKVSPTINKVLDEISDKIKKY